MALTPKQALFVREYLVDLSATQAAIRAGYSAKTAYSQGQRLLKNVEVSSAINAASEKRAAKLDLTAEKVLAEIGSMAFVLLADPDESSAQLIRAADKLKALELLGKHLKLFVERIEVKADESFAEQLRQARERAQRK